MTQRSFKTGLIFASWAMLLIFGCHKKKPPVPQEPQPPAIQGPAQAQPQPTPSPTPTTEQQQATTAEPEEKPTPARRPRPHPPVKKTPASSEKPAASGTEKPATGTNSEKPPQEAKNIPPKVVIQEGGTNSTTPQVSSGQKENSGNQPTTEQLLEIAENNLRNLKRDLNDNEQSTVNQIRDWMTQSRQATKDADPVRAHTLALKARLLSDELVKSK